MTSPHVVRVLNGRLAGTEKVLPERGRVSIGHEYCNDVVLRDPATRGIAVDLEVGADDAARVTVLAGAAGLLGSTLEPGRNAVLPPFVPLQLGDHMIAWGDPASPRWSEAGGIAARVPEGLIARAPDRLIDAPLELLDRAGQWVRDGLRGWRPAAIAGFALLITTAYAAAPTVREMTFGNGVVRADRALAEAGLAALEVSGDSEAPGGLMVTGVVGDDSDRLLAQRVLDEQGLPGTVDVQTSAELAGAAADVARIQGHAASARPLGRTIVELRTSPLADADRARLEQAVRSDVGGLGKLVLRDDLPATDETPLRTVADVTKKVATVVAGDPAYIKTADGAYYFTGAMMPTGHRLVAIQGNVVRLEKSGKETRITF